MVVHIYICTIVILIHPFFLIQNDIKLVLLVSQKKLVCKNYLPLQPGMLLRGPILIVAWK